jgi:ankyrin repeat protein
MLKKLKQRRLNARLLELVASKDLQLWPKVRDQISAADLTQPIDGGASALERCITHGNYKLLGELLHQFPRLNSALMPNGESMLHCVFGLEDPLPLLSAMLSNGLSPNTEMQGQRLVELALQQPAERAMLVINRLSQHGADLNNPKLLIHAIRSGHQPLVKFLADSGAPLDAEGAEGLDPQLVAFAQRVIDDKKIRDMWA